MEEAPEGAGEGVGIMGMSGGERTMGASVSEGTSGGVSE